MRIYKKEKGLFCFLTFASVLLLSLAVLLPAKNEQAAAVSKGQYVLLLEEVDEALQPHLHVGDRVIDRRSRKILGDVLEIRAEISHREIFSERDNAFVAATVPGKYDLRLTLSAEKRGDSLTTASGEAVRLGQVYYFRTYDFTGEGRVVELL